MNKNKFVKFSLTLISAAVLAACSSGGSKGGDDTAAKDAAAKAAAAKAAQEAADKAAKAAAAKAAEEKVKATTSVGHKLVKKNKSNFVLNIENDLASSSTGRSDNMSIELYPSLDTIVVSVPLKKQGDTYVTDPTAPIGYLEDFDFRGNTVNTSGQHKLNHIYKTAGNTKGGVVRTANETKTSTAGTDSGLALVYQEGRKVYISNDQVVGGVHTAADLRDRTKTVAEVYGHRTFVDGNSLVGKDANGKVIGSESALANAPFGKKDQRGAYTEGTKLSHVQYGRVTSKLDQVKREDTKNGLDTGAYKTKVVSYGEYGVNGTEDSYFYRGVGDTAYNADLAAKLAGDYATYNGKGQKVNAGSLTYQGHAVTYGFKHSPVLEKKAPSKEVPNALSAEPKIPQPNLVSGTHVTAKIDLATKNVAGSLYDVWSNGASTIAKFDGKLENNGSISGTSMRSSGGEGTFNANLFGEQAQELGGSLASKATDPANSWGAVFGAKVQNVPGSAPAEGSAWGVKTDENK
ncbi:transferrin-binding protein-like solute binding protein [Ursidibacter maritimus]|uniref:transferrin-binding protein-like solute binding protein n=1 Tax=Ursidibacter maritimus TaxID=1331689 RepID=UPI001C490EA7|nr:transferrin-binding protein-like solute binding protein [Ursidibacter maritimus]MBV6541466.1 transferrin-binding protein-like solute binding protein [Ursidibacter maritimus]